jgi:G3E family GTPase
LEDFGRGKTTAIINALKTLLAEGRRVGVITNDKGRYQVDTAFFGAADVPTAEVPGGCFRCNYGDFQERIAQLRRAARPEVLFAESVGCV